MNNHPMQMNSINGSYCNNTPYQHNQLMRMDNQAQTGLVSVRQNLVTTESVDNITPLNYQNQAFYDNQLQQIIPSANDNQGYMYTQPDQMSSEPSLYHMSGNTAYVDPPNASYRPQINYVLQPGPQPQVQLAPEQYNNLTNRNIPLMHDQHQQYCPPFVHSRQMANPNRAVDYQPNHQQNLLNVNANLGRELIDQGPLMYQQPMDSHPTIKQQHQQQQQQQQRHQQQQQQQQQQHHHHHQQQQLLQQDTFQARGQIPNSPLNRSTPIGVNSLCYSNQLRNPSNGRTLTNLTMGQNRMTPRSKSDLEASNLKGAFEHLNNNAAQRLQYQRCLSTTSSYMNQQQVQEQRVNPVIQPERRQQIQDIVEMRSSANISQDWLDTMCRQLIEHMDRFGICVIDNFLGLLKGESILREVQQLYNTGQYTKGRLVGDKVASRALGTDTGMIRSDRVIWIDGCENGCEEINNLIQTLCSVITNSSRLSLYSNNGLDKIVINKRTKAHVACYPGNGTRYIKHVDNPNGDGRVITSIYYLNKDWNTKRDGGLLRMFPAGINQVANIEPLFDRVLFFWSDRRNPHEVLPAYRDRFAITVWYISESQAT